jgi:UPF0755 protein
MKKISILTAIVVLVLFGGFLFYKEGTLPVNKTDKTPKIFVIEQGEALDSIINNLAKEELIRNRVVFYWIVKQKGIERKIQAGDFRLMKSMDAYTIAEELTHGTVDVWVTIPEGLRKEEVAEIMSQKFGITETEFNALAQEGFLYPDTYLMPKNPTAQQVIDILTNTFNQKFTEEMKQQMIKKGMTQNEVVTLASILEREAFGDADRQDIANVLYRRLDEGIPLQVDATVQYVLGYQPGEKRWWKKDLTFEDLKINSPYNTYVITGLPPAPIASPGIETIQAVINAEANTPYLFYIHDAEGNTHYAKDSEGHQSNINKYLK